MTRVAIIGAGPCGLSQLRAFQSAADKGIEIPEIVCFERQSDWGGLWNYTWRAGTDEHGEPAHSSMYRYLWSNGPKECLEFGDYTFEEHFGKPIPSFPPREPLRDYILGRANKSNVRDWVRFNHAVRDVQFNDATGKFSLRATNLVDNADSEELFDYVVVATGHFSVPNIPQIEGIDTFPGRVIHGHDFRDAVEFAGQQVLVVGASYSAEEPTWERSFSGTKSSLGMESSSTEITSRSNAGGIFTDSQDGVHIFGDHDSQVTGRDGMYYVLNKEGSDHLPEPVRMNGIRDAEDHSIFGTWKK